MAIFSPVLGLVLFPWKIVPDHGRKWNRGAKRGVRIDFGGADKYWTDRIESDIISMLS